LNGKGAKSGVGEKVEGMPNYAMMGLIDLKTIMSRCVCVCVVGRGVCVCVCVCQEVSVHAGSECACSRIK